MNGISQDRGRSIAAVTLIGAGIFFLLAQIFNFSIFGALWPLFIILPGLAFLYSAHNGGKASAGLAVPGTVITGTGLILAYQNFTGHWESWAYIWTLYPVFVGLALGFISNRVGDDNLRKVSRGLVRWGGIAFVVAAAIFELLIFGNSGIFGSIGLPVVLIGIGALMLLTGFGRGAKAKNKNDDDFAFVGVNGKSKNNGYSAAAINPDLQRKIDAALAEDDDDAAVV